MADSSLSFVLIPEIDGATFEFCLHPGGKNGMLMKVIGWEFLRDHFPRRSFHGMNVSASPEQFVDSHRRFRNADVISENLAAVRSDAENVILLVTFDESCLVDFPRERA